MTLPGETRWTWPAAIGLWALGQAAVVALFAGRFAVTAAFPTPVEATTDLGLACGQLLLACLLGPVLLATPRRSVRVIALALPFTVLAAALSGRADGWMVPLLVVAWLAVLALFSGYRPVVVCLLFLTVAGPVLFYASMEYAPRPVVFGSWPTLFSPTLGVCTTGLHFSGWRPFVPPLGLAVVGIAAHGRQKWASGPSVED